MTVELHLVRHARAAERGPAYPDDALRPLVAKGEAQARALALAWARMDVSVDLIATSPWLRAHATAQALAGRAGSLRVLDALAQGDPAVCARALRELTDAGPATIAAVGHEPWLSALASWLLTGDTRTMRIRFRKAATLTLTGELRAGGMVVEALVPARVVQALLRSP